MIYFNRILINLRKEGAFMENETLIYDNKKTVLIVDDEQHILDILTFNLKKIDYKVYVYLINSLSQYLIIKSKIISTNLLFIYRKVGA